MADLKKVDEKTLRGLLEGLRAKGVSLSPEQATELWHLVRDDVLYPYVDTLITQTEAILDIDPSLPEREILEALAKTVTEFLEASAATIRIFDPQKKEMVSFGSYPYNGAGREESIPFEDTIAGEVVRSQQSYLVPNIMEEEKYRNKEEVEKLGFGSMLAVPVSLPRFSLKDLDTEGVLQIYFREKNKVFTPLEVRIAEMLSRRVSYVIARKRIMDLHLLNVTKNKIVEQIFQKLGRREGVKLKEVFNLIIPELIPIMRIERCSLFSVSEDRQSVVLEAGYPERQHGIGNVFSVKEPYIDAIVNQPGPFGDFEHEKIYPTYILIEHPQESRLLPSDLKRFLANQQIHSVLYVPLKVDKEVNYFLAFDAQASHRRFGEEEIEIFTFFGKELMKALRFERMDDILHDFKNPAIAASGFVKRVRKYLKDGDYLSNRDKIDQALDIVLKETSRIQELALTLHAEGREEVVDLTEKLRRRFLINEEAIRELKRENLRQVEGELESPLWIRCSPLHIERVLDNLLNNASNAIPEEGGELRIRAYRKDPWAVVEITNTGEIRAEDKARYLLGESRGRGLHITTRLVKRMGGKMELESEKGETTFRVMFPIVEPPRSSDIVM